MSGKKQKHKEYSETEPVESEPESTGSARAEEEARPIQEPPISNGTDDLPSDSDASPSKDDLLDEVRRSLIEEESREQEKQPTLWKRVTKGLKKSKKTSAQKAVTEETQQPPEVEQAVATPLEDKKEIQVPDAELGQLDELMTLLETSPVNRPAEVVEETPQKEVDDITLDELKKQAFQPREEKGESENLGEVRSIVLEGGEEVFVEVESKPQDVARERRDAFQNALQPYRQYIYFATAFLGLIAVMISGTILFSAIRRYLPAKPIVDEPVTLPFPTSMILPGGLQFTLNRGVLDDGQWNPAGPEWLEGTEICRWIAIPWSLQLEAVLRTLNPDDTIELVMSNNDRLVYRVYSIHEVSIDEIRELETDSPCLLLILAKADSDLRWVLTALP